jgi:hypothetical protein
VFHSVLHSFQKPHLSISSMVRKYLHLTFYSYHIYLSSLLLCKALSLHYHHHQHLTSTSLEPTQFHQVLLPLAITHQQTLQTDQNVCLPLLVSVSSTKTLSAHLLPTFCLTYHLTYRLTYRFTTCHLRSASPSFSPRQLALTSSFIFLPPARSLTDIPAIASRASASLLPI